MCFRTHRTMNCSVCGIKCVTRRSGLCLKHWLISKGEPVPPPREKRTILNTKAGNCNSSDGFHRCTLPLGHNGIHEELRDGKTFRWGRLCNQPAYGRRCVRLSGHIGDHKSAYGRTWKNRDVKVHELKKCNLLTPSGSFHCIKRRGHSGYHQYEFQGLRFEWSTVNNRVILRGKVPRATHSSRRGDSHRSGHQGSGLETVGTD
jgi:hypothetical protein